MISHERTAMTLVEQIAEVEQGIDYQRFGELARRFGVSEERLRGVLDFSATTLHRRKHAGRFNTDESNKLYWFERLLDTADQVLEDPEETKVFMTTGNLALGGAVPLDYARTAPGLEAVQRLLYQLDHGVVV
jgi:putative toxin-antitoxin system antitoxin component (TIGR02293 family)